MTEYANGEPVAEVDGQPVSAAGLGESGRQYDGPAAVKLSHTTIATALACPRKYRYRYVDQLEPIAQPATFAFGRAVHTAIAAAYARQKTPTTAEEVAGVFAQHFAALNREGISYKERESYEDLLKKGRALVALWYEKHRDDVLSAKVLACEAHLSHDVDVGLVLRGYADIIEERDGKLYVGDHKTVAGWGESDEVVAAKSVQLTAYSYLCWKKYERLPDSLYLTVLKKTKTPDAFRYYAPGRTLDEVKAFEDYLRRVADLIRFYEREGVDVMNVSRECSWCAYAPLCWGAEDAAKLFQTREQRIERAKGRDEKRNRAAGDALVVSVDPKYDGDEEARKIAAAGAVVDHIAADDE